MTTRPEPCRDPLHAHGTWGLAETFDRTCAAYLACVEYDRTHDHSITVDCHTGCPRWRYVNERTVTHG